MTNRYSVAKPSWTPQEEEHLRALAMNESIVTIAERLNRSASAIRHRARKLGIALKPRDAQIKVEMPTIRSTPNSAWKPSQDRQLRELIMKAVDVATIAMQLNRTPLAIRRRATILRLSLKKIPAKGT